VLQTLNLSILLGPFHFFRLSLKKGVISVVVHVALVALIVSIATHHHYRLRQYSKETIAWAIFYWLVCSAIVLIQKEERREKCSPLPEMRILSRAACHK